MLALPLCRCAALHRCPAAATRSGHPQSPHGCWWRPRPAVFRSAGRGVIRPPNARYESAAGGVAGCICVTYTQFPKAAAATGTPSPCLLGWLSHRLLLALLLPNTHFARMRLAPSPLQILALGLVLAFCASGAEQASARSQKHRFDSLTVPSLPVDATGTPVIMQGLERRKNVVEDRHHGRKEAKRPVYVPRGSASLVPAGTPSLPRTPSLSPPPAVTPYNPPAMNSPSDRVIEYNHSFQLNRGLGNNPSTLDAYIRYNLNR